MEARPMPILPRTGSNRANRRGLIGPMAERWQPPAADWIMLERVSTLALPAWVGKLPVAGPVAVAVADAMASSARQELDLVRREARIAAMADLVRWMAVESSARWRPENGRTYCDHYAEDWMDQWWGQGRLADPLARIEAPGRMPRTSAWLWWRGDHGAGDNPPVVYGETVVEHGATSAARWLLRNGAGYGWVRHADEEAFRRALNERAVPGLIYCETADPARASHVTVALPDDCERHAGKVEDGRGLLQTEAGGRNRMWTRRTWYRGRWASVQFLTWRPA